MKKILSYSITAVAISLFAAQISCSKKIENRTDNLPALNPASTDIDAGMWKPVLLTRPDTFAVAAPAAITAGGYIGELNEIKGLQQGISHKQKETIEYWCAGNALRWNEIMRELVAKHNLPPYQNEDGTYPIPNSLNPFNYPEFPFSNPPYAARAYAYISAAQYDALVTCWYYKKLYSRSAPYKNDSTVNANTTMIAKSDLPSYPSEAAVLAGVTAEMMKMLFPTEVASVNQKVVDAQYAALASGSCVRSDWTAGEALGRQIASVFIARGKVDNAGKAVGTQTQWDSLATATEAKGEIAWKSLEIPARNPMLPFFGNVKPFLFDSLTTIALRPGPPPSTSSDQMKKETQEVYDEVNSNNREHLAIVQFWADGAGTYTPPGHWNSIACQDFLQQNYSEVRWVRNLALLNMAMMDAAIVCWNAKYYYFNPRPSQLDPRIKTLTGLPNFPSYISGHSTFSAAACVILSHIIPARSEDYKAMTEEASLSRLYGGIHYRSDIEAGKDAGNDVGDYAVQRALTDGAE